MGGYANKHIVLRMTYQKAKMHVQVGFNVLGLQSYRKRWTAEAASDGS